MICQALAHVGVAGYTELCPGVGRHVAISPVSLDSIKQIVGLKARIASVWFIWPMAINIDVGL
jgi:hypothetical protein